MKFVPDSVLDYALKVMWHGSDGIVFVSDFDGSKKKVIKRCEEKVKELLKDNDAVVIFKEYIVFYKNKRCGLCTYNGNEILPREYDELCVLDAGDGAPDFVETVKLGYANVYSLSKMKFIIPKSEYKEASVYPIGISVKKDNLYGVVDFEGKTILECEYQEIWYGGKRHPSYTAKKDGRFFIFDEAGKNLTPDGIYEWDEARIRAYELIKLKW